MEPRSIPGPVYLHSPVQSLLLGGEWDSFDKKRLKSYVIVTVGKLKGADQRQEKKND